MIYLKSIGVGVAFLLGAFYAIFFLIGIVSRFAVRQQSQDAVGFFISVHSPLFWLPFLLIFAVGFFWGYRRFSK